VPALRAHQSVGGVVVSALTGVRRPTARRPRRAPDLQSEARYCDDG